MYKNIADRPKTFKERALINSEKETIFAGKRFLGFTKRGSEVWISMELNKKTKDLLIKATHNLDTLLEEGAQLAQKRIVLKKGISNNNSIEDLMRRNLKNMGGEVTSKTIVNMKKLIAISEMKDGIGFKEKKVTRTLFMYASNAIFEGDLDVDRGGFGWSQVIKTWGLPHGDYFTLEYIPFVGQERGTNG